MKQVFAKDRILMLTEHTVHNMIILSQLHVAQHLITK